VVLIDLWSVHQRTESSAAFPHMPAKFLHRLALRRTTLLRGLCRLVPSDLMKGAKTAPRLGFVAMMHATQRAYTCVYKATEMSNAFSCRQHLPNTTVLAPPPVKPCFISAAFAHTTTCLLQYGSSRAHRPALDYALPALRSPLGKESLQRPATHQRLQMRL